jgi:hypothetical protein
MAIVNCLDWTTAAVAANYVSFPASAAYTPVSACTFTMRANFVTANSQRFFWGRPDVAAAANDFGCSINAGATIRVSIGNGSTSQTFSSVATVATGVNVFLAFRYQAGVNLACTVNATHNTTAPTLTAAFNNAVRASGVSNTSAGNANPHAKVWDLRYYNSYLSNADLDTLRTTGVIGTAPTCNWPCDEGTGTTVGTDSGGTNGSIVGTVGWSTIDDGLSAAAKSLASPRLSPGMMSLLVR